jgi:hypothetical protein
MKKLYTLIFLVSVIFLSMPSSHAQCEPDTVNCQDTLLPGEFCPRVLPDAYVGQAYEEVITIIPPGQYFYNDNPVEVVKLIVTDVKNMPPGITYEANAPEFFPDTAYCVLLSGTPDSAGVYPLGITVTVHVILPPPFNQEIALENITDDTSVSITVQAGSGLDERGWEDQFVRCGPNPYWQTTMISLKTTGIEDAELIVYNLLGGIVYREEMRTSPGVNRFRFDGQDLRHGTYIYHVSTRSGIYTNRLIKLKN